MRTLTLSDRGKEVTDVQTRLRSQGFDLGGEGLDGFFGPKTEAALKAFQQEHGLLVDGVVGDNTWRELVEAGYALGDRLLYLRVPGFRGADVLALQVKLNLLGFNAGPERGIFDERVDRAIKDFQQNAGLPADGAVGESTLLKLDALRKAETGREGKKIPDRDAGFARERSLAGRAVVLDPGHGGADDGLTAAPNRGEKRLALDVMLRLAALLRAEGCRVALTRERDEDVALYRRAEIADAAAADYFISFHLNGNESPAAGGGACYFFQRGHYYSEHGAKLAAYVGRQLDALGPPLLGCFGRNYALLREPKAIAVIIEPFFATNPDEVAQASRPGYVDRLAQALLTGLANYLTRS